jgi:prepilin-type N-terminal cleavage/methylation domain-containing protein
VKRKRTGFTLVELLAALGIIALMVGLLIPALSMVRRTAKETKQKAQFTTIELTLTAFKNDYGDYPRSDWPLPPAPGSDYCGAQKLAEALVGWDLLGFHPKSDFRSNGRNDDGEFIYDANNPIFFDQRRGPYLELATFDAFRLGNISIRYSGLFFDTGPLAPNTFVLCDVFGEKKIMLSNGKTIRAGAPILYYRANTSAKTIREIYNVQDNDALVQVKQQADNKEHPLTRPGGPFQYFYEYIRDPKIIARPWPYRPDSYILISAGADGLYGTGDDIRNFGN